MATSQHRDDIPGERRVYPSTFALADLPWFELRDSDQAGSHDNARVVLVDDGVGPIADVHSHLALTYLRRKSVDLWRKWPHTETYLPLTNELDLDIYVNQNMTLGDRKRMEHDLALRALLDRGMRRTHTAPNLLADMADAGIIASFLLPIDFPAFSTNAETFLDVAGQSDRLFSLGSVHPYASGVALRLADQKARGARGVKVHPAIQMIAPDNARAIALYRVCAELDLPVLWHGGPVGIEPRLGRYLSQMKHYWRAVRDCPETTFIIGHSGALQMEMALELANAYPNVFLEISSQSVSNVRRIVAEGPPDRIMFGSDWPFYHQVVPLAKALLATEGRPEDRRRLLWDNAARLFDLPSS